MNNKNETCITKCYTEKENDFIIFHPFLGLNVLNVIDTNYCVSKSYTNKKNIFFSDCDKTTPIEINIHDNITNPIKPENYLKFYFKLNSINDVIKYINDSNLLLSTKSRIFDFTFLEYNNNLLENIDKFIELFKLCLPEFSNIDDNIIIKLIKKIKSSFELNKIEYPFNLLFKIKKFLDNNI